MNFNIYKNTLVTASVTILSGDDTSNFINSCQLPSPAGFDGGSGTGALRRIILSSGFPATTLQFNTGEQDPDNISSMTPILISPLCLTDGTTLTTPLSIPTSGGSQTIKLNADWFDSVQYFQIVLGSAVGEDTTIFLSFQPIYQGNA